MFAETATSVPDQCWSNWAIVADISCVPANVYRGVNIFSHKSYAVKLELSLDGESSVEREYSILKELEQTEGIPRTHWFGREASYDGLVLDLLGPSLHELVKKHKKFHVHTIAHLAGQLVSQLKPTFSPYI